MVRALFLHVCPFDRGGFPQPLPEAQSAEAFDNREQEQERELRGGVVPVPVPVFVFQLQPALFLRINF